MKYNILYNELIERDRVTIARDMWPELAAFVKYCRARGAELRGGFENGCAITIHLK